MLYGIGNTERAPLRKVEAGDLIEFGMIPVSVVLFTSNQNLP